MIIYRFNKNQPIVCPKDIHRYFVSGEEAGLLCLLACFLGNSSEIFIPNLSTKQLTHFPKTIEYFFNELGLNIDHCETDIEAKEKLCTTAFGSKWKGLDNRADLQRGKLIEFCKKEKAHYSILFSELKNNPTVYESLKHR